MILDIK